MNPHTGELKVLSLAELQEREKEGWIEIDNREMTPEQKRLMKVSLHDHRSGPGKKLTAIRRAERNKYAPHVGAKQLSKVKDPTTK